MKNPRWKHLNLKYFNLSIRTRQQRCFNAYTYMLLRSSYPTELIAILCYHSKMAATHILPCTPHNNESTASWLMFSGYSYQSKTEFILIGLLAQLFKISYPSLLMSSNVTITPAQSARDLGVIFDSTVSISDHISPFSESCFLSIRDLRRIRNTLNFSTARTIATSLIYYEPDYCNSLFLNLPQSQLGRLQLILNSSARELSLKLPNSLIYLQFLNLFTGSKLSNASNIKLLL